MQVDIISVGNSQGIRIPKTILKQCGFESKAEMIVEDNKIIIVPANSKRKGWAEAAKRAANKNEDILLDSESLDHLTNDDEWQW